MIEKMKFVSICCNKDNFEKVLKTTMDSKLISLELASNICDNENNGYVLTGDDPYGEYLSDLETLAHSIGIKLEKRENYTLAYSVFEIENIIKDFEAKVNLSFNEEDINLTEDDRKALNILSQFDFEKLHDTHYIYFGFGRLSIDSYKKLKFRNDLPFDLAIINSNNQYHWICYVCSKSDVKESHKILNNLFFEHVRIPDLDVKKVVDEYYEKINDVYNYCYLNHEIRKLYDYISIIDNKYIICGFVPEKKLSQFKNQYQNLVVDFREKNPEDKKNLKPPTLLKNNWFFKPFELFVEMYSLPNYYDFDPTMILALAYCLLFGIMFGDLGQGFVLFILGMFFEFKTKNKLAAIVSRVSISSMIFGFLFGSFFGNEEILTPLHRSIFKTHDKLFHVMEQSFTMKLLIATIFIGMSLIILSMVLNIYKNFKRKKMAEIYFGVNGLPGLIFYGFVVYNAVSIVLLKQEAKISGLWLLFVIIPFVIMFFKHPLEHLIEGKKVKPKEGWGGYIIQNIFEMLEIILTFISNTMSYLRVGGFVLSHAGMMLVVLTISDMFTGFGSLLALIIGNIFVIGLEGLIVGIQTLRLQYYEMFSRYYEGGGRKFEIFTSNK